MPRQFYNVVATPYPKPTDLPQTALTHTLIEDAQGVPAGTIVTVIALDGDNRTVRPVYGGDPFQVTARQLGGDEASNA